MRLFHISLRLYLTIFACLIIGVVLAACGTSTGTSGTSSTPTSTPPTPTSSSASGPGATATAAETALIPQMTFVGTPTAKIVSGTTFAVSGKLKNGDDKQHDIYVQATLLDASGKVIATTTPFNVDNVAGGATVSFTVQGTTPQPTWSSVQIKVVRVAENINGSGGD
ncbi:MAG: FxLYD domain-containing protein [Ktedonobacteraceae bacterium]